MKSTENILLIRLKSIGDILLTLPAVHAVRKNFPQAKLHFLVSKEHSPLLRGFSEIDEIIPLDRAVFRAKNWLAICSSTFNLARQLRGQKFSLVVDFQGYGETAWLSWFSNASERWGSVYRPARAWAYTRGECRNDHIHAAEWNLCLLQQCGLSIGKVRNEYVLPNDALDEASRFFAANGLNPAKPTIFIQPFTSSPQKNWPLENYLKLTRHWRSHGLQVLFGGSPSENAALEPARKAGFPVSAGVSLLVTGGLMKLSTLTIGGDTGALHLAVAMGKRVIMIMESLDPGRAHPFQHPEWTVVPRQGKFVTGISIETVLTACERALSELKAVRIG